MVSKGNSMELPLPVVQYNLRSRGRVVGGGGGGGGGGSYSYLLRLRRGAKAVDYSGMQHSQRSRKPTSRHPRKVERKAEAQKTVVRSRSGFVIRKKPYPYLAMRHYNQTHQESEHYAVSKQLVYELSYFNHVGFLHLVHFKARRKSVEDPPKSSYFVGLVHERPHGDVHVSFCFSCSDRVLERYGRIDKAIPRACRVCGLDDEAAFELESMRLREEAKALGLPENESLANYQRLNYSDVDKD